MRNKLLKDGAIYVMRAAQSKGTVDLLALWPKPPYSMMELALAPNPPWIIQAKHSIHGGGYMTPAEREALLDIARRTGAVPVFARPGKNGRGVEFTILKEE